jgi:hypothetical protein
MEKNVVAEEVAISDFKAFAEYHLDDELTEEAVKSAYPESIKAIVRGRLLLTDYDAPEYWLKKPLKSEGGNFNTESIVFHTRVPVNVMQDKAKGIDLSKDALKFSNRIIAYLTKLPSENTLYLIDPKPDYKVLQELSGLFM